MAEIEHLVGPDSSRGGPHEQGGDPACWLTQVCPECGRFSEEKPPTRCEVCGAELPSD